MFGLLFTSHLHLSLFSSYVNKIIFFLSSFEIILKQLKKRGGRGECLRRR